MSRPSSVRALRRIAPAAPGASNSSAGVGCAVACAACANEAIRNPANAGTGTIPRPAISNADTASPPAHLAAGVDVSANSPGIASSLRSGRYSNRERGAFRPAGSPAIVGGEENAGFPPYRSVDWIESADRSRGREEATRSRRSAGRSPLGRPVGDPATTSRRGGARDDRRAGLSVDMASPNGSCSASRTREGAARPILPSAFAVPSLAN